MEGPTLLREALSAGWDVIECFATSDVANGLDADCPVHVLDEQLLAAVADVKTPQGVIAVVSMSSPFDVASQADARGMAVDWALVADGISDPGNLGTMMRSAEAAGASRVLLVNDTVDPFAPKVVRSSAGAVFHVPVSTTTYPELRAGAFRILGLTSHEFVGATESVSMHDVDVSGRIAVVVGSEAHGIAPGAPIDEWVTIPHVGRAESLNAAMAATVMCMHVAHLRAETVRRPAG